MKKFISPFSYGLKKGYEFTIYSDNPVYTIGDYSIYKQHDDHYIYTYLNIIISERCGYCEQIINDLFVNKYSGPLNHKFINFDRPKQAIKDGTEIIKKYGLKSCIQF